MTPKRRAEYEKLVDALVSAVKGQMMSGDTWDIERADRARAALVAFVEQEEGELHTVGALEWKAPNGEKVYLYHVLTPNCLPGEQVRVRVVKEAK